MTSVLRKHSKRLIGALAGTLVATALRAQESTPIDLTWEAPPGCPAQSAVVSKIRSLVGASTEYDRELSAEASVMRTERGFLLKLLIRSGDLVGERRIESASCQDLADATAVALALLLQSPEPLSEQDLQGPEPTPTPPEAAAPEPARPLPRAAESPPRPPPDAAVRKPSKPQPAIQFLLQAPRIVLDVGPLPRPSVGAGIGAGARYEQWQLLATVHAFLPQTVWSRDFPGYGADLTRLNAELWGCRGFQLARVELAPCITTSFERMSGSGVGQDVTARTSQVVWMSAGAGAIATWFILDSMAIAVGAGGRLELSAPEVVIEGLGKLHQLAPARFTSSLAMEWIW